VASLISAPVAAPAASLLRGRSRALEFRACIGVEDAADFGAVAGRLLDYLHLRIISGKTTTTTEPEEKTRADYS